MPANIAVSFNSITDSFRTAREHAGTFKRKVGGADLTLVRCREEGLPVTFDVAPNRIYGASTADRLRYVWHRVVDRLWGPRHDACARLHSTGNIKRWIVEMLEAPRAKPEPQQDGQGNGPMENVREGQPREQPPSALPQSAMEAILKDLWPDHSTGGRVTRPSLASLDGLKLDSTVAQESFKTWLRYTGHQGPFQSANLDRGRTRLTGNRLTLVYNFHGSKFEFDFTADAASERSMLNLQRLHRVATQKGGKYKSLAELVTAFKLATVKDEVPSALREYIMRNYVDYQIAPSAVVRSDSEQGDTFLLAQKNGKLTRTAQRAVDAAVKKCTRIAIVQAEAMAADWNAVAAGDRGDPAFAAHVARLGEIAALVPQWERDALKKTSTSELARDISTHVSYEQGEVDPKLALVVEYEREPGWIAKWKAFFSRKDAGENPRPIQEEIAWRLEVPDGGSSIYVPETTEGAKALRNAYHIAKDTQPRTAKALARVIFATAWHKAWRDEIVELRNTQLGIASPWHSLDPDSDAKVLRALMAPIRVGRGTFAGLETADTAFRRQLTPQDPNPRSRQSGASPQASWHSQVDAYVRLVHPHGTAGRPKSAHEALMMSVSRFLMDRGGLQRAAAGDRNPQIAIGKHGHIEFARLSPSS